MLWGYVVGVYFYFTFGLVDFLFFIDGELYSVTFNNFLGTEFVILRNMGFYYFMKTEYLVFWFNGEFRGVGRGFGGVEGGRYRRVSFC